MVVLKLDEFMYLGKSFEAIPKEHETNPMDYDEAMSSDDVILWQGVTEVKLKSMYSNEVLDLIEAPKGIKPIGVRRSTKGRKW